MNELLRYIDAGEASSIALAQEVENGFLILDDYAARILASKLGLAYTGTIGVLLKGKELGLLPSQINYVQELKSAGFWMSKELENRLLKDNML